jgi:hypothetical protein
MIGFVTTQVEAQKVNDAVAQAQLDRGLPVFWLPGMCDVYHGLYSGLYFIPCDDETLNTPLRGDPPSRPVDFPEFQLIIDELGGLDSRIDLPSEDIIA